MNLHARRSSRRLMSAALLAGSFLALMSCATPPPAPSEDDVLASGFKTPPSSARPRVWWHWMNGNITKDGIQKDIEWMARVGIGGLQNFDVDLLTPQVVSNRLVYMTPEWKEAFRFAAEQADNNGLELAIASSPGWSQTGGPWVPPADAMKKLVWSETLVTGGERFNGQLLPPPRTTGRFADAPLEGSILGPADPSTPELYRDAFVVAYRVDDAAAPLPTPIIRTGGGDALDVPALTDWRLQTSDTAERGTAQAPGEILIEYTRPVTIRSLTLSFGENTNVFSQGGEGVMPRLEAEAENGAWRHVTDLDMGAVPQATAGFGPTTARRFRILLNAYHNPTVPSAGLAPGAQTIPLGGPNPTTRTIVIRELRLSSEARVNRFEVKAGFGVAPSYYALDGDLADEPGVSRTDVIDLSARMTADGALDWTPPAGQWKVLRFGYSLTGTKNHPTTKEASGLEVDKMDAGAVRRYIETYLGLYRGATGADLMGARGLQALLTDSIEVGAANWTPDLLAKFRKLRGYDATPWLPVLSGAIIGSRLESDAFLYDYRRTLMELLTTEHYGTIATVAREHGLTVYGEAIEDRRPLLADDLAMRRYADIPMAALWTYDEAAGPRPTFIGDMRGAASVAHVYGKNIVAAESLTSIFSPWAFAPNDLKAFVDLEFVSGVNRPVIHTSVHQPLDDKQPGFSLLVFGQYFNRHDTWAEMAKPWVDYMARSSFLLQQGRNHADVAYFIGEERPATQLFVEGEAKRTPVSYAYNLLNRDMVISELRVDGSELTTPGGARYKALYLGGDSHRMTLAVLKRLEQLVEQGATLIGKKPLSSPSLADDPHEFSRIVARLWPGNGMVNIGKGRVIASDNIEAALQADGLAADFSYPRTDARDVQFLHRRLSDGHAYFLTNRRNQPESFEGAFRVTGKKPEIWRADTGKSEPVSYRIENGITYIPLDMLPRDALFVVFREEASAPVVLVPKQTWTNAQTLAAPWQVTFQPGRGAPATAQIDHLASLSEHADPAIRYFSGVAIYRTSIDAQPLADGQSAMLDLGSIGDVAEVSVNGVPVGSVWKAPYRVDITGALRAGKNEIEIRVANLWVNRLIGDQQRGAAKVAFTTAPTYRADAPLRPSGLIGPVTLMISD